MSFGYSVGDFIAVVQLAYTVYERCASSVEEFRDIGRDVGNTRIVLSAIRRYWEEEGSRGHSLIVAQQEELKQLAENSYGILKKIDTVLQKHRGLEDRAKLKDKLKWALTGFVRDIGPQRQALQENTNALAIFNATLTAENASGVANQQLKLLEAQGQLLKFLVTQYYEFQTGTGGKVAPAFSQIAVKDTTEGDDHWKNIEAEFEAASFNPTVVRRNQKFIKDWIVTVIPEEGEKALVPLTDTATADQHGGVAEATNTITLPSREVKNDTEQTQETNTMSVSPPKTKPPATVEQPLVPLVPVRPVSVSSHRSKLSTWQDSSVTDSDYVAKMIAKVLKSKYGEDCDDYYALPIKRAFDHLDWTRRGWISFGEVQKYCSKAGKLSGFSLDQSGIGALAKTLDKNKDNQVNREEFVEIVMALRQRILEQVIIAEAKLEGRMEAGFLLKRFFDNASDESMMPPFWHIFTKTLGSETSRLYRHDLSADYPYKQGSIPPLQCNFTNVAFVATAHCSLRIAAASHDYRTTIVALSKEEMAEYTVALDNVLKATQMFHLVDGSEFPGQLYPLDRSLVQMDLLSPGTLQQWADCPNKQLIELAKQCWDILDPILAFVFDLKVKNSAKVISKSPKQLSSGVSVEPPDLAEWRRLRMLERSKRILNDIQQWDTIQVILQTCREWSEAKATELDNQTKLTIEDTKLFHTLCQIDLENNNLTVNNVELTGLKRDIFRRYPSTLLGIFVDEKSVFVGNVLADKTDTPYWILGNGMLVNRKSRVVLEFHDKKKLDKSTVGESFIGYFGFNVSDVTNFSGRATVTKSGQLVSANGLESPKLEVKVTVSTDWKVKETWSSTTSGSLAHNIATSPIPQGWEAQRTSAGDVYFFNSEQNKATACLWWDPIPNDIRKDPLRPLPPGWTAVVEDGALKYRGPRGITTEVFPAAVKQSTFETVIQAKTFCQPLEFFSQELIAVFEKAAAGFEARALTSLGIRRQDAYKRQQALEKQEITALLQPIRQKK
ncbi:EF-hand [Glarea lozoyensis ATCC 20868]|uniref:EF-hand n=1 Tax=Glarea lozoyensis (strain ATCC 20868 / MF5171) TaxID=1116229 RepID=S3CUH7_GLAL2|nr:EF-hand [Glarea lozoyensis ATCC 20868]EPE28659.1 EF-hand [Glarea lozoyensis ATCC 20868]